METDTREIPGAGAPSAGGVGAFTPVQERARSSERSALTQPVRVPGRSHGPQRSTQSRWINVGDAERIASGTLGALLLAGGASRRFPGGAAAGVLGGALLFRGVSGHCHLYEALHLTSADRRQAQAAADPGRSVRVQRTVTVNRPASELYQLLRDPQNLQRVMAFFAHITTDAAGTTHWTMRTPIGKTLRWDTRGVDDRPGELLSWESTGGSLVRNRGSIRFAPATGHRGTSMTLELAFEPPGGRLGRAAARMLSAVPKAIAFKVLQRIKNLAETGEIAAARRERYGELREGEAMADLFHSGPSWRNVATRGLGWFSIALGLAEVLTPRGFAHTTGLPERVALTRVFGLREIMSGVGILSGRRSDLWLMSRVAGDAMDLALLGVALADPRSQRNRVAAATAAVLGVTVLDVLSAWDARGQHSKAEIAQGMSRH